ncbi:Siderophore iron transporter-like protein [Hapsidospora chrysogenum ATCC 11550]|uniref:Siderophore iron transporter-like protein n=1 Tax=Hapsidospora chrysogenum (strain ATCC 11550 / CBS 779.69 / DSM 880 / IAM 14645 / JCM 23072 / IMI 49137) TaxID=857340 RepID=A0A086T8B6_HAPC1|nr:Siderophore iron transporter-like protein [Hapsidospora chrysogenum ATCC 11550]
MATPASASSSENAPLLGLSATTVPTRPAPPTTSAGVARIATGSSRITATQRAVLFFSIFLVGYAYGLESQVRSAYQPYATASFSLHSYLATINVLRSVVAVAVQPAAARVADVFGRFEVVVFSTALYTLGIAVEATAGSVGIFCAGSLLYQVGYTCIVLLLEVLVADFSSMRARVFLSYIPAMPFLVNTWISGNVTSAVLRVTTWRWGIGMWAIIYPVASMPLLVSLYCIERRPTSSNSSAAKSGPVSDDHESKAANIRRVGTQLYHQLDAVGLLTLVMSFSLVLAPLTITGQQGDVASRFGDPNIMVPLVIGLILAPLFVLWERRGARQPLVPFHLLTDRGVWAALCVRSLLNFAWYTQGNYLYTVLVVAFDFSVESATRILSLFSFFGVISGVVAGMVIYRIRRLKYIIVAGTMVFMCAFGLLIRFSGGATPESRTGLISGQVLMGLAGGLFAYPTQASIQASAVSREHVAILTGLYLSFYNVGSALGTCLSGAIWTSTLLGTLEDNLRSRSQPNATGLAEDIYNSPFSVIEHYPVGTEVRMAVIDSYQYVQRLLCIAGICLCVPMIAFALALRNPKLSEHQVQTESDDDNNTDDHGNLHERP